MSVNTQTYSEAFGFLSKMNDTALMTQFSVIIQKEREATADVILHLAEIGKRRLYLKEAYSSLFSYLVEKHRYSRSAAYRRIQAAKLSARCCEVIGYLKSGELNLTTVSLLEPTIQGEKNRSLIVECLNKSKQEVEDLLTERYGREIRDVEKIRRLPVKKVLIESKAEESTPAGGTGKGIASKADILEMPLLQKSPASHQDLLGTQITGPSSGTESAQKKVEIKEIRRVKIEFTADEQVAKKIERAKDLLRGKYPKGRIEDILNEALDALLDKKDPERKVVDALLTSGWQRGFDIFSHILFYQIFIDSEH